VRRRDLETDLDGVVGHERALRPPGLLEVDDVVLGKHLEVVVDGLDIAVETLGQLTDAVRALGHDAPEELHPTVGEERPEVTRVLEVDDMRHLFAGLPAVEPIERILTVCLFGVGRDPEHRGVVFEVAVFEEARLGFGVVHHDLLVAGAGTVDVVGVVGRVGVGFVGHGGLPLTAVVHLGVELSDVGFETGVLDVVVDAIARVVVVTINVGVIREVVEP